MKLHAIVCINTGLYMDIRPEIEVDTENYEVAKQLVRDLHKNFYALLTPEKLNRVDHKKAQDVGLNDFVEDLIDHSENDD